MSFDRLAPHYNWLEKVLAGNKLQLCRTTFLPQLANAQSILLLGEGHGRFLPAILQVNPRAHIVYVDQSPAMLQLARNRLSSFGLNANEIRFKTQDVFQFQTAEQFDAIVTHFFLDCFTVAQLEALIPRIAGFLRFNGLWHIADFQLPTGPLRRARARLVLALAYSFFQLTTDLPGRTIVNPCQLLERSGLCRIDRKEFNLSLLYSELWKKTSGQ